MVRTGSVLDPAVFTRPALSAPPCATTPQNKGNPVASCRVCPAAAPHQKDALKALTDAFAAGEKRATVVFACGAGKTHLAIAPHTTWPPPF